VAVSKDTLHVYLAHLEDAFLIRSLFLHTSSERRRMVNPRKAYPVNPGLIPIYERSGRPKWGHALETAVFLELERRGYEMGYVRTPQGFEVDFLASSPGEAPLLVQVCADVQDPQTYDREVRALAAAAGEYRSARALLDTLESTPPAPGLPPPLEWRCAGDWLLGERGVT
jgi:hypothetical protein